MPEELGEPDLLADPVTVAEPLELTVALPVADADAVTVIAAVLLGLPLVEAAADPLGELLLIVTLDAWDCVAVINKLDVPLRVSLTVEVGVTVRDTEAVPLALADEVAVLDEEAVSVLLAVPVPLYVFVRVPDPVAPMDKLSLADWDEEPDCVAEADGELVLPGVMDSDQLPVKELVIVALDDCVIDAVALNVAVLLVDELADMELVAVSDPLFVKLAEVVALTDGVLVGVRDPVNEPLPVAVPLAVLEPLDVAEVLPVDEHVADWLDVAVDDVVAEADCVAEAEAVCDKD